MNPDGTVTWRQLVEEATDRLGSRIEARWIGQAASGADGQEWSVIIDQLVGQRAVARFDAMVARRLKGEPVQYVVGSWAFRRLELMVDRRVLIPRPETEHVVEVALGLAPAARPLVAVDLGTGSGAIAISLALELRGDVEVWGTDASTDALAVASANLAGAPSRVAPKVRFTHGDWYEALPADLAGRVGLVVANPPYVATSEELPVEVLDWEPHDALFAGADGLADLAVILHGAAIWLQPGGVVVCEIGATQADDVRRLATAGGLVDVEVRADLAGRDRVLVARAPG